MTDVSDLRKAVARGREVVAALYEYAALEPPPVASTRHFMADMLVPGCAWIFWSTVAGGAIYEWTGSLAVGWIALSIALLSGLVAISIRHRQWQRSSPRDISGRRAPDCVRVLGFESEESCAHGVRYGRRWKLCLSCVSELSRQRAEKAELLVRAERQLAEAESAESARVRRSEVDEERRRKEAGRRAEEERLRRAEQRRRRLSTIAGLRRLSPGEFEVHIARIYSSMGYQTKVTPPSGDDGVDVIAEMSGVVIAIQCKRYGAKTRVGSREVRELHGSAAYYGAHRAVLITTSDFTRAARDAGQRLGIELVDSRGLLDLVRRHGTA